MWPFDAALCENCNQQQLVHSGSIYSNQQQLVHSGSIYMPRWGALLIVALLQEQLLLHYKLPGPQGNKGYMKGQAMEL